MARSQFVYVSYIRCTPEKLLEALTEPQFMRKYWFDMTAECDWKKGSPWKLVRADGRTTDSIGEVLEIDPPRRLVILWQNEWNPRAEGGGTEPLHHDHRAFRKRGQAHDPP
jgi:uncharacterized protein YndB with AHSA1/START domain